jgi:hydrogenase maturation protease
VACGVVLIGVGNELRRDDAAGLDVVRRLRRRGGLGARLETTAGDGVELLDLWQDARAVVLVDTVRSGAPAGTIHRLDASVTPLPASLGRTSSHALGVADAIELARELGRLPRRVIVYGIEGARFEAGSGLTERVASALEPLAQVVHAEVVLLTAERVAEDSALGSGR